jgi:hypothetical protein
LESQQTKETMSKNTNFTGQPILNQLLMYLDRGNIRKIAAKHHADRYVKKYTTHNHLVVMLFIAFEGYQSIREAILGLLLTAQPTGFETMPNIAKPPTVTPPAPTNASLTFHGFT